MSSLYDYLSVYLIMVLKGEPHRQLVLSFWNIEGYNSQLIGNKLEDPEFLNVVSKSDILGLAELHAEKELSIPGFKILKQKNRPKKVLRGGIRVFVRNELSHLFILFIYLILFKVRHIT